MDSLTPSMAIAAAWSEPRAKLDGLALIDHLYNQLDGMYPNLWRANFKNEQAIANWRVAWLEAFVEEGITPQLAAAGIKVCRREHDMPPSLPKFLRACQGGAATTDPEALFYRAQAEMGNRRARKPQNWPSPPLFWAAVALGDDLLHSDYRSMKGRWTAAMDANRDRMADIPDVSPDHALPAPKLSREEAEVQIAQVHQAAKSMRFPSGNGQRMDNWLAIADEVARGVYKGGTLGKRYAAEAMKKAGHEVPAALQPYLPKQNPMEDAA